MITRVITKATAVAAMMFGAELVHAHHSAHDPGGAKPTEIGTGRVLAVLDHSEGTQEGFVGVARRYALSAFTTTSEGDNRPSFIRLM